MPRTRGTVRIQGHDYSESGEYFVTICTYQMRCLFGEIKNGQTRLNPFGQVVEEEWLKTSCLRSDVKLDEFVIMPNHVHGIVKFRDFQAEQKLACDPFKRTAVRPYAYGNIVTTWYTTAWPCFFIEPSSKYSPPGPTKSPGTACFQP